MSKYLPFFQLNNGLLILASKNSTENLLDIVIYHFSWTSCFSENERRQAVSLISIILNIFSVPDILIPAEFSPSSYQAWGSIEVLAITHPRTPNSVLGLEAETNYRQVETVL